MGDHANGSASDLARWQRRIFWSVWVTYFAYYLCRLNMPVAKTRLCDTYGWDAERFGIVLSALTLMYAVGQFVNGQLADRYGSRAIASLGVLGSVIMNLAVFALLLAAGPGTADSRRVLILLAAFWGLNGFFQAMGWSPMVKVMAHWYPVERRGRIMGLLGTCYQFGGACASLLAIFLVGYYAEQLGGDWRNVFLVPSLLLAVVGVFFFLLIRNRPEDVGLPTVNVEKGPMAALGVESSGTISANVLRTLRNPHLWVVAWTFFLLDVNRYGFVNWMPAFLDSQGIGQQSPLLASILKATKLCIHPLAGSAGAITAGWASDRFFGGRRAPVIAVLLALLGVFSVLFPSIDPANTWLVVLVVAAVGFCTYGPHILMVGHAAQDFGKKSGAAGASGFIDAFGYIGATLAGWGAGRLIQSQGYEVTFITFGSAAFLGALLACIMWKVRPESGTAGSDGPQAAPRRAPGRDLLD
ncbi:MAG: MFS transporter [Thermoguttaceae bacterium]